MNKLTRLKRCKRCISTLMLMCCSLLVWAQNTVTGTVLDESNLEVIGANVKEKGTANGAITDMNGVFHLKVSNLQKAVLQISFMGYEPQEVPLNGRKQLKIILKETANELQEVTVVAYGTQKKETLTGAISAVSNDALVRSPNASVANTLAGQITGLSSVQTSGQPGQEDPKVFIRGVGSLTESASSPLILVDGVERSFYQMDPNEIESVTVLKDASATAVFGVRGANGVILVTTRRGKEGKAKISVNSSVGIQMPTRMLEMADSYTYATLRNEIITNDKPNATENDLVFNNYAVERFRLNDEPIMYPSIDWRRYLLNKTSVQTQHNLNISGGTKDIRYFISLGFLYQNGLLKQFEGVGYDNNYKYKRYNYRANLDFDATKTTTLKIGIGGIVGNRNEPMINDATNSIWTLINQTTPFSSPGVIDGKLIVTPEERFDNKINLGNSALPKCYGTGYSTAINNTMNLDLLFTVSKWTGDNKYKDVAIKHAITTMKNHFRPDYTCWHVVSYNNDGTVERKQTHQGKNDDSSWSRGQAWAVYGYTSCYRETNDTTFLNFAVNIADMIMERVKTDDAIPYWDYDAPVTEETPRDASAAAVTAAGFIELSTMVPNGKKYLDYAEKILKSLSSDAYLAKVGENQGFILMHSVGSLPNGSEIDTPLNYADYYYLEALKRFMDLKKLRLENGEVKVIE